MNVIYLCAYYVDSDTAFFLNHITMFVKGILYLPDSLFLISVLCSLDIDL